MGSQLAMSGCLIDKADYVSAMHAFAYHSIRLTHSIIVWVYQLPIEQWSAGFVMCSVHAAGAGLKQRNVVELLVLAGTKVLPMVIGKHHVIMLGPRNTYSGFKSYPAAKCANVIFATRPVSCTELALGYTECCATLGIQPSVLPQCHTKQIFTIQAHMNRAQNGTPPVSGRVFTRHLNEALFSPTYQHSIVGSTELSSLVQCTASPAPICTIDSTAIERIVVLSTDTATCSVPIQTASYTAFESAKANPPITLTSGMTHTTFTRLLQETWGHIHPHLPGVNHLMHMYQCKLCNRRVNAIMYQTITGIHHHRMPKAFGDNIFLLNPIPPNKTAMILSKTVEKYLIHKTVYDYERNFEHAMTWASCSCFEDYPDIGYCVGLMSYVWHRSPEVGPALFIRALFMHGIPLEMCLLWFTFWRRQHPSPAHFKALEYDVQYSPAYHELMALTQSSAPYPCGHTGYFY